MSQAEKPQVSKVFLYSIMLGMLTTGTANTIVGKYLDLQQAPKGEYTYDGVTGCYMFLHPYLQTSSMFFGELIVYLFLFIKLWMDKRAIAKQELLSPGTAQAKTVKMKTNINPLWLAIPASCDVCGSTLMFVALTMVSPSVYQMMRGLIVVITALLSIAFLKRK